MTMRATEADIDARVLRLSTLRLTEVYRMLRSYQTRSHEEALVLSKAANELHSRLGDEAFDAMLDYLEAAER